MECAAAPVEDRDAENVRRQHVAGELDALKVQSQDAGEHVGQRGFADSRQVLDQQVAARQQAGYGESDRPFLAEDDAVDICQDGFEFGESHGVGAQTLMDNMFLRFIVSHQPRRPS